MNTTSIKEKLNKSSIFHSETKISGAPSVIGYEKKFKWSWIATQLNTFIVVSDFGDTEINTSLIEHHLSESFEFSKKNYTGWPRGLQSGLGVITILLSNTITEEAKSYCTELKSGKKWAGFTIPIVYDTDTNEIFQFQKNPIWGRIYYPHFKKLIHNLI